MAGLRVRMFGAMGVLYALAFGVLVLAGEVLGLPFWVAPVAALVLVGFQWLVSPLIIGWIYDIHWVDPSEIPDETRRYAEEVCRDAGISLPRFGVVPDGNPTAFAYGWTPGTARVVVTEGLLEYCEPEESRAVVGHELGHVVHNDFVVMTLMQAVPVVLYLVARMAFRFAADADEGGAPAAAVGGAAYVLYLVAEFGVLLVSRYRETYADEFAAETTGNPNHLASALVTVSYGLARESARSGEDERDAHAKWENALMLQSPREATALVSRALQPDGVEEGLDLESVEAAMSWDLWSTWATWWELKSTHPLTAKRVLRLSEMAEEAGREPLLRFDLEKPEMFVDDFLGNLAARHLPWIVPVAVAAWLAVSGTLGWVPAVGLALGGWGLAFTWYQLRYHRPAGFMTADVETLLWEPKANPVRGIPVEVEGRIVGRGHPGLWWSEDVKLDDGTGLLLVDYHQVSKVVDFFVGLFKTQEWVDEEVVMRGWYRRYGVPWLELYEMEVGGERKRIYTRPVAVAVGLVAAVAGGTLLGAATVGGWTPPLWVRQLWPVALILGAIGLGMKAERAGG